MTHWPEITVASDLPVFRKYMTHRQDALLVPVGTHPASSSNGTPASASRPGSTVLPLRTRA
jgi:hypothetical protein